MHAHQRPKVERYGDTLFAVFKTVRYVEHDELTATSEVVDTGEIMVFAGRDFVITVRHGGHGSLRPAARGAWRPTRSSCQGAGRGAARHRRPRRRRLPGRHGRRAGRHRPGRDRRLLRRDGARRRRRRAASTSSSANSWSSSGRWSRSAGPLQLLATRPMRLIDPGDPGVLPRRRRPPGRGSTEQIAALRRTAQLDPPGQPRAGDRRAERGHAQDHRLGGDHRRADDGLRRLRHELRPHARTALAFGYPSGLTVIAVACFVIHRGFRRNGWL